ncbi:hypothetical protein SLEP1_g23008 [Rubroshorea leprosula]|uniref:Uncharacterized protein n=1 Tax=Rubroshorea leprosula TaxID=152421 RepID=A0AAV5JH39_9ROSI|nr:hypothetical protein SLEP1_g23008 [Rubroshorea leprosula]
MDIGKWCNSGGEIIQLGRYYDDNDNNDRLVNSPFCFRLNKKLRWKELWMKFKEKKIRKFLKFFKSPAPVAQLTYDPYTYSQNFDQGLSWDEPENLSRSFSVRFADPSLVFLKNKAV